MKKNLISVIILALLIVNIVLTSIMMFSVTSASRKTAALVTDIASVLDLELTGTGTEQEEAKEEVAMKDIEPYDITDLTIPLKRGEDGKDHYCLLSVTLSKNIKHKDYKTYGDLTTKESLIKSEIVEVVGSYTMEELQADTEQVRADMLARIQELFGSDFIFNVSISSILFQ